MCVREREREIFCIQKLFVTNPRVGSNAKAKYREDLLYVHFVVVVVVVIVVVVVFIMLLLLLA